jgi:hypothetical protein
MTCNHISCIISIFPRCVLETPPPLFPRIDLRKEYAQIMPIIYVYIYVEKKHIETDSISYIVAEPVAMPVGPIVIWVHLCLSPPCTLSYCPVWYDTIDTPPLSLPSPLALT